MHRRLSTSPQARAATTVPTLILWTTVLWTTILCTFTPAVRAAGPTAPGPTTVACAWTNGNECWVTGAFTADVTPATADAGIAGYRICRSIDSAGGFSGCDVDLVPIGTGGTSILVSGSHLPSDGFRRAYFFRAQDQLGEWGPWNTPRYVRADRNDPQVSADNASPDWFATSRTATLTASDAVGGTGANTGLADVRYRWNVAINTGCTNGTATTSGATLTVPEGDNILYLCARDQTGRVTQWSGQYRVDTRS